MFAVFFLSNLTSYTKFELNSLRNNEITMKLLITHIFGCRDRAEVRNASYNNEITMKLLITDISGCRDRAEVRNDVIFKQWL